MAFERRIDEKIIQNLLDTDTDVGRIFTSLLRPSIMAGQLFMAIRVDRVDYYVGANRFMEYSGKSFKINPKMYGKSSKSKTIKLTYNCYAGGFTNRIHTRK